MTNQDIKFTVIIPTRERADTLKWALKTCTTQDYDNLEIIVSDNFSQDDTRAVVESCQDKRIKYINTGKRVSMSSNWEFALSHVEIDPQRYVTFVGDDDGLLPNALQDLNELIQKLGDVDAIVWNKAGYHWPKCYSMPNLLFVPLEKTLEKIETKSMLRNIVKLSDMKYGKLPCLYTSFVKSTKIDLVRKKTGKFFHSMTPDVYSGIALSTVIDYHYLSNKPYSMNGASKHSNGISAISAKKNGGDEAFKKYMSEDNIPFHSDLIFCVSIPIIIIESALQAKDHLQANIEIDFRKVIEISLYDSIGTPKYTEVLICVNEIAKNNNIMSTWHSPTLQFYFTWTKKILKAKFVQVSISLLKYRFFSILSMVLYGRILINGNIAGLKNIYDATLLCKNIIDNSHHESNVNYMKISSIIMNLK